MKSQLYPHSSKKFSYDSETKEFVAEASDLDNRHLERIYYDACDVGLTIISDKTGFAVTYYMANEYTDAEGDVTHWTYFPTTESIRTVPACIGTSVTVFND